MTKRNAVVGQSGGPTAVINQSLVGVIEEARKSAHIGDILGARHGVRGIVKNDFIRLNDVPDELLERIAMTPAAALGSTRDKPDQEYCRRIFESFQKNNVGYFFYIGGNDSADTARIVNELAKQAGYELRVFHIPKTIDNDLRVHDHCPGYGSAARYVACAIMGDNLDNRSLPGIKVDVIMGRNAGWLTAASVLGRKYEGDGPHLVYVPESPVTPDRLLADVDAVYRKYGRCLIAASEGMCTPKKVMDKRGERYQLWAELAAEDMAARLKPGEDKNLDLEPDDHGNRQLSGSGMLGDFIAGLIKRELGPKQPLDDKGKPRKLRVRADTFGYPQRSFVGCMSKVDAKEARLVGQMAVRYSADNVDGSVAMRRLPGKRYRIETFLTPLETVARDTRDLPAEWIVNGNDISQAFIDYARPLVGPLPEIGSFDELKQA